MTFATVMAPGVVGGGGTAVTCRGRQRRRHTRRYGVCALRRHSVDGNTSKTTAVADADVDADADADATDTTIASSRRSAVLGGALLLAASSSGGFTAPPHASASTDGAPSVGDCADCVGVVNDLLNSCPEETEACISSQNDDEYHFAAPWAYPGDRTAAMRRLVAVAVGTEQGRVDGRPARGPSGPSGGGDAPIVDVYGRDKREVAEWILNTTGAFVLNKPLPERPGIVGAPRRGGGGMGTSLVVKLLGGDDEGEGGSATFGGGGTAVGGKAAAAAAAGRAGQRSVGRSVVTRVAAYDEREGYVRLVVGETSPGVDVAGEASTAGAAGATGAASGRETGGSSPSAAAEVEAESSEPAFSDVFDVEFLFLDNDEVCNIRVASRDKPKKGRWSLSYVDGLRFNNNSSRDLAEELRIALGWEILPVISEFDPRFNNSKRLWFEKALTPMFDPSVMDSPRGTGRGGR